ncbi:hypothetical protein F4808DRAFT_460447 [Astrocystis sublimbata]|nr:hypothetical protein F4808DRAFT_460447 [Astrocystis sublimbata]
MFRFALSGLLSLVALAQGISAVNLVVNNKCHFDAWCGSAANDGTFTPAVLVKSWGSYLSPQPAHPGVHGVVVKCGLDSSLHEPYQLEVTQDKDMRTWFDLSNLNGSPFHRWNRHAEMPGTKCVLDCKPGQTDCEWPYQLDCYTSQDVILTLC